jgi:four helix bundle protein
MSENQTSNFKLQDKIPNTGTNNKKYDLRERLLKYATDILFACYSLPRSTELEIIRRQLSRAGTSIGANFEEADGALTKKDFTNKVAIARKEAKETLYWLRLINASYGTKGNLPGLIKEADEIIRILSTILIKTGHSFRI